MDYTTYDPATYDSLATTQSSAGGGMFFLVMFIVFIAIYVYMAYALQKIAKKTNTPNDWLAWIPIANIVLMFQIVRLPLWWILGLFVPFLNIVLIVYVWWKIAEACHRPGWWGILMLIGPINLILIYFMAFKDPVVPSMPTQNTPAM